MTTPTTLPTHPRTGLRALGITRRGPVWPVLGGDGTGDGGDGQGGTAGAGQQQAAGDGRGAGQQQPPAPPAPLAAPAPQLGPDGQPWDPDRAARLVANLRAELAEVKKAKQGGQQQGQGQAPAPHSQQQAGQAPADTSATDRAQADELAVWRAAADNGASAKALTDSRSFMDQVSKLDPSADDHGKKLAELIKKTVEKYPHYRSGQAPGGAPRGGSDGTGKPGAPTTPATLADALAAHYSGTTR
jgi:hypothetical protein